MSEPLSTAKASLRHRLRSLPRVRPEESARVRDEVGKWLAQRAPVTVCVYLAMPGEIDLEPLVSALPGLRWVTTRTPERGWLTLHPVDAPRELHRFGYQQPVAGAPEISPGEIDLVLVPGLGFDRRGGRVGHGAGYYDQLLSRMRDDTIKVGVTLERYLLDQVPMGSDDVPMQWLATERGVRRTGSATVPSRTQGGA